MTQEELIAAEVPIEKFSLLSKEDLITYLRLEQDFRIQLQRRVAKLEALNEELKQQNLCIEENYITIKNKTNDRERIEMKKYCRHERQHTLHKETR